MKKISVSASGKLMLFGEHAVAYGKPCIVTAVSERLRATVTVLSKPFFTVSAPDVQVSDYKKPITEIGKGIIAIGKVSGKYCIYGGNKISNEKIAPMELFINTINNMNASHLTELYERKISNLGFNVQGGAGLGLIDMIRKSKQKLQYSFEPLTQGVSFFMVTATVFSN